MTDTKLKYFITIPGRPRPKSVTYSKKRTFNNPGVRSWMEEVTLKSRKEIRTLLLTLRPSKKHCAKCGGKNIHCYLESFY